MSSSTTCYSWFVPCICLSRSSAASCSHPNALNASTFIRISRHTRDANTSERSAVYLLAFSFASNGWVCILRFFFFEFWQWLELISLVVQFFDPPAKVRRWIECIILHTYNTFLGCLLVVLDCFCSCPTFLLLLFLFFSPFIHILNDLFDLSAVTHT